MLKEMKTYTHLKPGQAEKILCSERRLEINRCPRFFCPNIYEFREKKDAQPAQRAWIGDALRSGLAPFKELALKLFRKRHYILNFFVRRITSAISEGINNKIKRLKRMAYVYRDVSYFLLKIHQHCGLLNPGRFN